MTEQWWSIEVLDGEFPARMWREAHGVSLIESAITRPYTGYYRPIAQKAAALLQSLATNHGFVDGNKRTAVFAMNLLLGESGGCAASMNSSGTMPRSKRWSWPWSSAG